jgi:hypothetical protein
MLIIRDEQMSAFAKAALDEETAAHEARLRAELPEHCEPLSPKEMRALIEAGLQRAVVHGIVDDASVARYLALVVRYGADFGDSRRTAGAGAILRRSGKTAAEKLDAIEAWDRSRSGSAA